MAHIKMYKKNICLKSDSGVKMREGLADKHQVAAMEKMGWFKSVEDAQKVTKTDLEKTKK